MIIKQELEIQNRSKISIIKDYICAKILAGEYKDKLPGERILAEKCGVNFKTVNRVVSELVGEGMLYRKIGEGTFIAKKRRKNIFNLIGFICPSFYPYLVEIMRGVEETIESEWYNLIVHNYQMKMELRGKHIDVLYKNGIKGLILYLMSVDTITEKIIELQKNRFPFVLVDTYSKKITTDYVVTDNIKGTFDITKHLIKLGHRKIVFLSDNTEGISSLEDREAGYLKALNKYGIEINPRLIIKIPFLFTKDKTKINKVLNDTIHNLISKKITAIFATVEMLAIKTLELLTAMKIKVPEEISVAGFGDSDAADFSKTSLTTVAQDSYKIGSLAGKILINKIRGGTKNKFQQIFVPGKLIIRNTTAKIKRGGAL